jgi:ABC-type dipeptide/oligopeptide/nickel transport system permease subunit
MAVAQALSTPGLANARVGESYWRGAWIRFKANRLALVSAVFVIILVLTALLAPLIAPYPYQQTDYQHVRQGPSTAHPIGTDDYGRDLLSRLIYSLRTALLIAIGAQIVNVVVGVTFGALAGYYGGMLDNVLMRITDMMYAFPTFLFAIFLVAVVGRGPIGIILAIGATSWVGMARLVRGEALGLAQQDFVEAARALGASGPDVIGRYVLPNAIGPIIVSVMFGLPSAMLIEAGLSLLGLGVAPPTPSWGVMISEGFTVFRSYPYRLAFPAIAFAVTMIAFSYLGDGLNDALNPRES